MGKNHRKTHRKMDVNPLVICNSLLLKMAIEIVDLPIEHGDVPFFMLVYQRVIALKTDSEIAPKSQGFHGISRSNARIVHVQFLATSLEEI